ncbi:MAG TPA: TadE/TadG family type IV pilus assembly protein [Chloroflexota bacterium]|jgi:Flp pilus assembly protein TadG
MRQVRRAPAQSLLEFALVLPIFLLLLFGMIDFSRLLFTYISLVNGTRELARVAALPSTVLTTPTAPVSAFNNLTLFGGSVTGATQVTLAPPAGQTGNGSIACNSLGATGCLLTLSTVKSSSSVVTTLTNSSGASGTVSYTFTTPSASPTPDPSKFGATGNGDFVLASTVGADLNGTVRICPLPLTNNCLLGAASTASDGFINVDVVHAFKFNPLFENRLAGVIDASFVRPISTLRTATRTYVE